MTDHARQLGSSQSCQADRVDTSSVSRAVLAVVLFSVALSASVERRASLCSATPYRARSFVVRHGVPDLLG